MAILSVLHYILIAIYPFNLTCDDFQMIWQWNLWILDQYGTTAKCSLIQMPAIKRFPLKIKVDLPGIYYCLLFYIIVYYIIVYYYMLLSIILAHSAIFIDCYCFLQSFIATVINKLLALIGKILEFLLIQWQGRHWWLQNWFHCPNHENRISF